MFGNIVHINLLFWGIHWIDIETIDGVVIDDDIFDEIKDKCKGNKIEVLELVCKPNEYKNVIGEW